MASVRDPNYADYIAGSVHGGGFSSGVCTYGGGQGYGRTIAYLREVLDAVAPDGNPYWNHEGVTVSTWNREGRSLLTGGSARFATRGALESFLAASAIEL